MKTRSRNSDTARSAPLKDNMKYICDTGTDEIAVCKHLLTFWTKGRYSMSGNPTNQLSPPTVMRTGWEGSPDMPTTGISQRRQISGSKWQLAPVRAAQASLSQSISTTESLDMQLKDSLESVSSLILPTHKDEDKFGEKQKQKEIGTPSAAQGNGDKHRTAKVHPCAEPKDENRKTH